MTTTRRRLRCAFLASALTFVTACSGGTGGHWYRGNTHAHTLWSDGDAAPETAVAWYKENGYHWLALTDHDVLLRGERWFPVTEDGRLTDSHLDSLRADFGPDWIETREHDGVV